MEFTILVDFSLVGITILSVYITGNFERTRVNDKISGQILGFYRRIYFDDNQMFSVLVCACTISE